MKKVSIILVALLAMMMLSAEESYAQHYVGVRGGYGYGTARFYIKREMSPQWGLYHGGVSWKYYTHERFAGGVEADMLFMMQGYKEILLGIAPSDDELPPEIGYYSRKINSIMIPLFWQPHFHLFKQRMTVFLNAGVTFSYNISSTEELYNSEDSSMSYAKRNYQFRTARDNRWGYGLCGGGGIGYSFGRFEVVTEARYYIGYSDIQKNQTKYPPNGVNAKGERAVNQRSPLDGLQMSVACYFRLGKGGILAKPGQRAQQRMIEQEWERREAERKRVEEEAQAQQELQAEEAELSHGDVISPDTALPESTAVSTESSEADSDDVVCGPQIAR